MFYNKKIYFARTSFGGVPMNLSSESIFYSSLVSEMQYFITQHNFVFMSPNVFLENCLDID